MKFLDVTAGIERSPLSIAAYNLLAPNLFLALCIASVTSSGVILPILLWIVFVLMSFPGLIHLSGDANREYLMGVVIGSGIVYSFHLLLVKPLLTYRFKTDVPDPRSQTFVKRVYWAGCVIVSARGIGWNYEVPNVPAKPNLARWRFVASSCIRGCACYLLLDAAQIYLHANPLLSPPPHRDNPPFASQTLTHFCLSTFCWVFSNVCMVNMQYLFFGALAMASGISEPHLWPPLYGNPLEAYTIRRLWSRTWQLMMRRQHSGLGKMAAKRLKLRKGSLASRYTQLYVAFALSGFTHAIGDFKMAPHLLLAHPWSKGGFPFFMMQAVAITIEDVVIALFKRVFDRIGYYPPGTYLRVAGYAWTLSWSIVSWGWYCEFHYRAGLLYTQLLPLSPLQSLIPLISKLPNIDAKRFSGLSLVCIAACTLWQVRPRRRKFSHVPIVGPRIGFLNSLKTMMYGLDMCIEGFNRHGLAPCRYRITTGWVTLISDPAMAAEMLKESDELMQPYEVNDEVLQVRHTLGEHFVKDQYQNDVTRVGMNRHFKDLSGDVLEELVATFRDELGDVNESEWTDVTMYEVVKQISSRASNRLFVGLPLCRDPSYVDFTIRNSFDIFQSATAINLFPTSLQPYLGPLIAKLKTNTREGSRYWLGMVQERLQNIAIYGKEYPEKPNDALSWLLDETNEQRRQTPDIISRLLFLNFAGILSTGLTIMRVIHDLVRHPEYLPELYKEIECAIDTHGFTAEALDEMHKLDSFARESARLSPLNTHTLLRRVRRDYTFSNSFSVPAGTRIALNQPALNRSEAIWPDALKFDGFRHAAENKPTSRLVSTANLLLFGHGRHTCAGRVLAVEEIKATMAYLIANYTFKAARENDMTGPGLPIFKLMTMRVSLRKREP